MQDIDIILITGQSNAVGCTNVSTLDEKLRDYYAPHVYLYEEGNFHPYYTNRIIKGVTCYMGHCDTQMGIEYGMSYVLNKKIDRVVGLIRYAFGGTTLYNEWQTEYDTEPRELSDPGSCYHFYKQAVENGLQKFREAGFNPIIRGMVWMHGETEAAVEEWADVYKENLEKLFAAFRAHLGMPDLKIIVGEIATNVAQRPYSDKIRKIQREVCRENENNIFLSTKGIKIGTDGAHFDGPEDWILGQRFGRAVVKLLKE